MPQDEVPGTDAAYRAAIAGGDRDAWAPVALTLRGGREKDAIAAFHKAIAGGDATAWISIGNLLPSSAFASAMRRPPTARRSPPASATRG